GSLGTRGGQVRPCASPSQVQVRVEVLDISALYRKSMDFIFARKNEKSHFINVKTEIGFDHYAEKRHASFPWYLAMPANSIVNTFYILIGVYWLFKSRQLQHNLTTMKLFSDIFSWMSIVYGFVQWSRIATQTHLTAVLDQWFTFPIFAWAAIWAMTILDGFSLQKTILFILLAFLSYFLIFVTSYGFEIALGYHIILAVYYAFQLQYKHGNKLSRINLLLAVLACCGFVVLKLLDHQIATYKIFQRFTGHFWSKICDVAQIHYSFAFFYAIYLNKQKKPQ
ncbi:unnamed protein product, partial [Didymodactylos carnosus]